VKTGVTEVKYRRGDRTIHTAISPQDFHDGDAGRRATAGARDPERNDTVCDLEGLVHIPEVGPVQL
jgi:hypothetical protein